jgi:hypothetical protein
LRFRPLALSGQGQATSFEILKDGVVIGKGETTQYGDVEWPVEPDADDLILRAYFGTFHRDYAILLRALDPINTLRGIQQRLQSLGYFDGECNGEMDDQTKKALQAFQIAYGLLDEEMQSEKVNDAIYRSFGESKS